MTRIELIYDGHPYSVAGDLDDVKARLMTAVDGGEPFWLTVNEGGGTVKPVDLLITSSTQISVAAITSD